MNQAIANKMQAQIQRENGVQVYSCEEIVGDMKTVKDFGAFNAMHKSDLEQVVGAFLIDYCTSQTFTPAELNAYRLGLGAMRQFFDTAELETELYIRQAETDNKKSVG